MSPRRIECLEIKGEICLINSSWEAFGDLGCKYILIILQEKERFRVNEKEWEDSEILEMRGKTLLWIKKPFLLDISSLGEEIRRERLDERRIKGGETGRKFIIGIGTGPIS